MEEKRVFWDDAHEFAKLFTVPNELSYMDGKFFEDGMKAIEAFDNNIRLNLVEWAVDGNSIFYRTGQYVYVYYLGPDGRVINCSRFAKGRVLKRWDTWMNLHSCSVGKDWLTEPEQKVKRIPAFG